MKCRVRFALLALLPIVCAGCKRDVPQAGPPPPPNVEVAVPVTQKVTDYEYFTGRTDPIKRAELKARVSGYLMEANFPEGGKVKKDADLFVIDARMMQAEVAVARANQGLSRARLKRADDDLQRGVELGGAISKEEMDKRRADRAEAVEALTVADTTLTRALVTSSYTTIKAPFDGRISRRMVDPGNTVKADETILSVLVSDGPMYVYFDVDERTLLGQLLKESRLDTARGGKLKIDVGLADEEGYPHPATVNFVDNRVDPGTGSMWMRAEFDKSDRPMTPGLFVRVRYPLGQPYEALLVAEQAVGTDQGQKFVFVVDEKGKAEYRRVKTGRLQGGLRVIRPYREGPNPNDREGIKPNEKIVVAGIQRVKAGAPVTPKEVPMLSKVLRDRAEDDLPLPPGGEPKPKKDAKPSEE